MDWKRISLFKKGLPRKSPASLPNLRSGESAWTSCQPVVGRFTYADGPVAINCFARVEKPAIAKHDRPMRAIDRYRVSRGPRYASVGRPHHIGTNFILSSIIA